MEYDLLPDRVLGCFDIAAVNLACASGLPGSEKIDMSADLALLDEMAAHVDREINRNYHHFLREPGKYNNSQAQWCVLMMITVVQQDFGVRYNPKRIRDPDFKNSGDLFIHGMLPGRGGDGGTCASIPVLYTAIGRRLGWPIYLATTRGHVFCRWDDPTGTHPFGAERFNIEGSTLMGGHIYPDEFYLTWPEPLPPGSLEKGVYLRTLTPREELAMFLTNRGHCYNDNGKLAEAVETYAWAYRLAPDDPHYESFFIVAFQQFQFELEKKTLQDFYGNYLVLPYSGHSREMLKRMRSDMDAAVRSLGLYAEMSPEHRTMLVQHHDLMRQRNEISHRGFTLFSVAQAFAPLPMTHPHINLSLGELSASQIRHLPARYLVREGTPAAQAELEQRQTQRKFLCSRLLPPMLMKPPKFPIDLVPPERSSLDKLAKHMPRMK